MTGPVLALLWAVAPASLVDLVDIGPAMGRAGAVAARVDGGAAAFYNPAGLAFRPHPEVRIGIQTLGSTLTLAGEGVDLGAPVALTVETATVVPLLAPFHQLLAVGLMLQVLPQDILVVDAPASTDPIFPYYRNRAERLVTMAAVAVRPHPNLAFGAGFNYFGSLDGIANIEEGSDGSVQPNIEENIPGFAKAHAGVRYQSERLSVAFAYRQQFVVPFSTTSNSVIADDALHVRISSKVAFTPETFVIAAAWREPRWDVALEGSWRRWSGWQDPYARVEADVPLPSVGGGSTRLVAHSEFEPPRPRDVWRAAASGHVGVLQETFAGDLDVSGGYAYEPSPFEKEQPERTPQNLVDGPKHVFGLGLTWRTPRLGRMRFSVDLAGQAQSMGSPSIRKDPSIFVDEDPATPGRQTSNPGYAPLQGDGWVFAGSLTLGMELGPVDPATTAPVTPVAVEPAQEPAEAP